MSNIVTSFYEKVRRSGDVCGQFHSQRRGFSSEPGSYQLNLYDFRRYVDPLLNNKQHDVR